MSKGIKIAIWAGVLLLLGGLHWMWASTFWTGVIRALEGWWPLFALLAVVVIGFFLFAIFGRKSKKRATGLAWMAGIVFVGGLIVLGTFGDWAREAAYRDGQLTITDEPVPEYDLRFPYRTAHQRFERRQGDFANVTVRDAMYTDAEHDWATIVDGRGVFRPLEAVMQLDGDGEVTRICEFEEGEVRAFSGMFMNNMKRQINKKVPRGTLLDLDDVTATCDDGEARVFAPLMRYNPFPIPETVPAGVVEIDARGEKEYHRNPTSEELGIPVMPLRIAHEAVEGIRFFLPETGENPDMTGPMSALVQSRLRSYERPETTLEGLAQPNPDAGNAGDFLMRRADGSGWDYVSALTPRGDAEQIVAIAVVDATSTEYGEVPEVTIHRLPQEKRRLSNREVDAVLRTRTFEREIPWEVGYEIFELTPIDGERWSVVIGQDLEPRYRAMVHPDGSGTLHDFAGELGKPIAASGLEVEVDEEEAPADTPGLPADIEDLEDEELIELLEAITDELRDRQ